MTYDFDPVGTNVANKILNETLPIPTSNLGYKVIYPSAGPFYSEGNTLTLIRSDNTTMPLVYGTDYYTAFEFARASMATGKKVAIGYVILNTLLVGSIKIASYQAFGSSWSPTAIGVPVLPTNVASSPMIETYESYFEPGAAAVLPVFPDFYNDRTDSDPTGINDVKASVDALNVKLAIAKRTRTVTSALATPTAAQFNLDQVPNAQTASIAEHMTGAPGKMATAEGVAAALAGVVDMANYKAALSMLAENQIGNIVYTSNTLSAPDYLPATGTTYLTSSYPELAGILGTTPGNAATFSTPTAKAVPGLNAYIRAKPFVV